ncbi:SigE family RNA polymerase sigma factor [Streptacidiphilus neutrinimicus]|uniref:SigE family RNA polymerase sigma factor n=1 Tax=Streptacidiphilus neutrinimicus TaxID=105420 RepID=UPI0005A91B93|nr:SigE family RNA polymerase sigma factor [Streptacidiphilus neutrinimicus]
MRETDTETHDEFAEFAASRAPWLRRTAYLLSGDWHTADDLTQTAITSLYLHWPRVHRMENPDGYARTTLFNAFLAERRSPWRRVLLRFEKEPLAPVTDVDSILDLREALAALPPRQRATVVLRYYCELSVEQAAETLNCSPGTVKSQTARGLDALRRALELRHHHDPQEPLHPVTEGSRT